MLSHCFRYVADSIVFGSLDTILRNYLFEVLSLNTSPHFHIPLSISPLALKPEVIPINGFTNEISRGFV